MTSVQGDAAGPATVLDRRATACGEVALRRRGPYLDVIAGGVFLMSTEGGGRSERLLVRAALEGARPPATVLLGGLGVGFSLLEALDHHAVQKVVLVEVEEAVVDWHATHLRAVTGGRIHDPRVEIVRADLVAYVADAPPAAFDAVCLDVDNGPGWTAQPGNAALYDDAGVARCARLLAPTGRLSVWSAHEDHAFARRLARRFASVDVHRVPVARGEPDHVYVAAHPGRHTAQTKRSP